MGSQRFFASGVPREPIASKFLHGYGVSVKIWFEGELDERNWVWDFGGFKRAKGKIDGMNPKDWMTWLLDHTTIIADDDPHLGLFQEMDDDALFN